MTVLSRGFAEIPVSITVVAGVATIGGVVKPTPTFYIDMRELLHLGAILKYGGTGTIAAAWKIESGCLFYGADQIATYPGVWTDITGSPNVTITNPAAAIADGELCAPDFTALWAKISLTGITGDGTITGAFTGKG